MLQQQTQQPIVIQGYKYSQEEDIKLSQKRYDNILNNTYKVRAKELETIVTERRDILVKNKTTNTTTKEVKNVKQDKDFDLFSNEQIPEGVTRLMRG